MAEFEAYFKTVEQYALTPISREDEIKMQTYMFGLLVTEYGEEWLKTFASEEEIQKYNEWASDIIQHYFVGEENNAQLNELMYNCWTFIELIANKKYL